MKKAVLLSFVVVMLLNTFVLYAYDTDGIYGTIFSDVPSSHWASEYIYRMHSEEEKVLEGVGNSLYEPSRNVTRAEFTKMMMKLMQLAPSGDEIPFNDVEYNDLYRKWLEGAYFYKIVKGTTPEYFGGSENITRQDMALIIERALHYTDKTMSVNPNVKECIDIDKVGEYAKQSVQFISGIGVLDYDENGAFNPTAYSTRAETAEILCKIRDKVKTVF